MKKINNLRFLPRISEAEKRRRNPTYRNARKAYTKNLLFFFPVWIILLIIFVSVITNIENRILAGIVGLFLAASPIMLGSPVTSAFACGSVPTVERNFLCSLFSMFLFLCTPLSVPAADILWKKQSPPVRHLHRLPVSKIRGLIKKGSFRPWFSVFFCLCALYLC